MHQRGLSARMWETHGFGARSLVITVVSGVVERDRSPRQNVYDGVLNERREDEHETYDHPDVDRLDVGDARQRRSSAAAHRRRR